MKISTILATVLLLSISGLTFAQTATAPPTTGQPTATTAQVNKETVALIDQLKAAYTAGDLVLANTIGGKIASQLAIEYQVAEAKSVATNTTTSPASLQVDDGVVAKISYPDSKGYLLKGGSQNFKLNVTIAGAQKFNDKLFSINGKNYPLSFAMVEEEMGKVTATGDLTIKQPGTCHIQITIGIKSIIIPITTIELPFRQNIETADVVMLWGISDKVEKESIFDVWSWNKYPGLKFLMAGGRLYNISFGWEKWRGY